jgi:hypothetical protein
MIKRTRITTITHETITLWQSQAAAADTPAWCDGCSALTTMLTPEQIAIVFNLSPRLIYRWIEADQLHFVETAEPAPRICLPSLAARVQQLAAALLPETTEAEAAAERGATDDER